MRCNEVIRELAVPTDAASRRAIDEHLARCPACAAWGSVPGRLDRLWKATRPSEPTAEAWDSLWARVPPRSMSQCQNRLSPLLCSVP